MRILIKIEYKGTNFYGWQIQKNKRTVQSEIEKSLFNVFNENIKIYGSGRTDSGVHALAQTTHFDISPQSEKVFTNSKTFDFTKLVKAINSYLPNDIKVLSAKKVSSSFHAQFDAVEKVYLYRMQINSVKPSPLNVNLVGTCQKNPDILKMKKAATFLIGEHDFTSFCNAKTTVRCFKRVINYIKIKKEKDIILFEISGNGFLHNMIRIIVGTLVDVGISKIDLKQMQNILEQKSRVFAGKTVSSDGLYLKKVRYRNKFNNLYKKC